MRVKLSYIVAVYNGETYLGRCLDSLWNQGLTETEFEVICVDDCSNDDSVRILQDYTNRHKNMKLILHNQNKKTGTSVQEALQIASGDYVQFLGQDDWLEDGWGKQLVHECDFQNLDLICFNYNRVDFSGERLLSRSEVFKNSIVMTGQSFVQKYFDDSFCAYLLGYEWRAVFCRDYLKGGGIDFPTGVIYEDSTFLFKAIWYADRIKSINDYIYNYRLNDNSVTDATKRYKGYLVYEYAFVAGTEVLDLSKSIMSEKESRLLYEQALKYYKSFSYKVVPMSKSEKKIFYHNVKSNKSFVKQCTKLIPFYYGILAKPFWGYMIAELLYPLFYIKHLFSNRKYISY